MVTKELTLYEKTKAVMRSGEMVKRFAEILGSEQAAHPYISSVLIAVGSNERLQTCDTNSIIACALRAAVLRLSVDPSIGHAYIVPFKDKATFVIGYKGLRDMAYRTNQYRDLNVATIWQGQTVVEDQLTGRHSIEGYPESRDPIGYMMYFKLVNGFSKTFYMTIEELRAHAQRYSKSYGQSSSPWTTNFDDMCKKTVLRLGLTHWGTFGTVDSLLMASPVEEENVVDAEWAQDAIHEEENRHNNPREVNVLMQELGYDEPAPAAPAEPKPAPVPAMPAEMTIEDAEAIENSQGTPYGTLPTDKITFALNSVRKSLEKEPNPAYEHKAKALEIILAARRAGRPVQS